MTQKLTKDRAHAAPVSPPRPRLASSPQPRLGPVARRHEPPARYVALIAGPVIGFALAAMLAVSFALALAGGAGAAAVGNAASARPARAALFVL